MRCFSAGILSLILFLISSCDSAIDPISGDESQYSMYGVFELESSPNYIRVHDTSSLLTPESTRDLDVNILVTDFSSNITSLLRDSIIVFDSIYTHNFIYESELSFNNSYKIVLESDDGYRDSLISVMPDQMEFTLSTDAVECDERFTVELINIDLNAGEQLIAEAGIQLANTWYWTSRESVRSYDAENNNLMVGWSPEEISIDIFAGGFEEGSFPGCEEFTSNMARIRFTHIGYMEGGLRYDDPFVDPDGDIRIGRKIVLGRYTRESEVEILPEMD